MFCPILVNLSFIIAFSCIFLCFFLHISNNSITFVADKISNNN